MYIRGEAYEIIKIKIVQSVIASHTHDADVEIYEREDHEQMDRSLNP